MILRIRNFLSKSSTQKLQEFFFLEIFISFHPDTLYLIRISKIKCGYTGFWRIQWELFLLLLVLPVPPEIFYSRITIPEATIYTNSWRNGVVSQKRMTKTERHFWFNKVWYLWYDCNKYLVLLTEGF